MRLAIFAVLLLILGCIGNPPSKNETAPPAPVPNMHIENTNDILVPRSPTDVLSADYKFPEPPHFDFSNMTTPEGKLIVDYFFSPRCAASIGVRPEIDRLEAKYKDVEWKEFDITTENGTLAYIAFAEQYNLSTQLRTVPQALVNGRILSNAENINGSLDSLLANLTGGKAS